jgi:hypothetical protein
MEPPMTDETPSPTTRMPVPEPLVDEPTAGWPGATLPEEPPDVESAAAPPPTRPSFEPPPPVASPARRHERDHGRTASILFGLVFLGLGLWFFVEHTLGYELPRIRWSQLWPAALIIIGLWVVLGSMRRGSR